MPIRTLQLVQQMVQVLMKDCYSWLVVRQDLVDQLRQTPNSYHRFLIYFND